MMAIREYWNMPADSQKWHSFLRETVWYLRSEDLSELVLVRDIRDAVVRPPISQGKAPKWHGGIHLKNDNN